ncbi:uncharacterized protein [Palaemon carinicauda]|uniref:uncharacterized protein n=1 Tax=Palaemon carinicauda TaxID=392227 RepID=UPI0035B667A7
MKCLPSAVLTRFETDGYGVQWRDEASFTSVDVDHATEWVNAAAKTSGGLSTITQIDSATLKWMLSFHARSTITTNACDYYNVSQNENDLTPSELKLEARYEDKLVEQMLKYNLFEGRNPDKLTTIINKDVAPPHIEESLLESESKGQEEVKRFMKERLVRAIGQSKPSLLFSAAIKKCGRFVDTKLLILVSFVLFAAGRTVRTHPLVMSRSGCLLFNGKRYQEQQENLEKPFRTNFGHAKTTAKEILQLILYLW